MLFTREMQIETAMRYYLTPIRMDTVKTHIPTQTQTQITNVDDDVEKRKFLYSVSKNLK